MAASQLTQNFNFSDTTATKKIFSLTKRIRAVCGGTSASKTISILVWCIDYAQTTRNKVVTVVSESFPHLSLGAITDFQNIMKDRGYWEQGRWNDTRHTYTFEGGTKIEFYSVDLGKAHGPRRDILFVNECNNLPYMVVDQLITRTRETVWMDWNPSTEFWFYTEMQGKRDDIDFITLTYLDNEALDEITVREIESHKGNKNWWAVYGMGQLGVVEGRIYPNWVILDEIPPEARLERRGLDYGYSNDPTAIVDVYKWNNAYIWDEVLYSKGLSNKQIADVILNQENPKVLVIPDSAEPKSNDELMAYGVPVLPANKGKGSVNHGIQVVQGQTIFVTKRSIHIIKENRNYMWMTDKDGKILNEPIGIWNHAMDAGRYAMETLNIDTGLSNMEKYMLAQARMSQGTNFSK
jgi:phage terminase large subunit